MHINRANIQPAINNSKHSQYNHTLPHNIPSHTKFNLNNMAFFGETSTQTITNSKLAFIFSNRSIKYNQTGVYFQCPTPIPMRVPTECSFETLKSRMHNTLQLTNDQFLHEIYYRQPSIGAGEQYFFHSIQIKNDDDVHTMLMCNQQYPLVGPIELLCTINRTPDGILNLLRSTITPTHDAMLYYNGKWKRLRQGNFLGYSFTGTNPVRFEIPSGCSFETLKDVIKQVAPRGVPPNGIHETQMVTQLFYRQPGHTKYHEKLIDYQITVLKNNEDVLKVLAESNYWKNFCPIQILANFSDPVTPPAPIITNEDVAYAEEQAKLIQLQEYILAAEHLD